MTTSARVNVDTHRKLLQEKLLDFVHTEGTHPTGITGFDIHRFDSDGTPRPMMYSPVIIVVVQGHKWAKIGDAEVVYGEHTCFVAGVDMPVSSCIKNVSPEKPFLSLSLELDKSLIAQLAAEVPPTQGYGNLCHQGAVIQEVDAPLLDAFLRLLELIDQPQKRKILEPLIKKEIHYLLLSGAVGGLLRDMHTFGTHGNQIVQAIAWLQSNFTKPLKIDALAEQLHMAPSTFHKHFKDITTVSPLQYQKRLRLLEARRLMLSDSHDTGQASLAVGYDSLTQFNREYKRLFGEPPRRDVARLTNQIPVSPPSPPMGHSTDYGSISMQ